jgi:glucan biosynthesis protein C
MTTQTVQSTDELLVTTTVKAVEGTKATSRLLYIDNIRTFLTALVLVHHIMIIYAGTGSWIYTEGRQDLGTTVIGSIFTTVNQAFFMGLFLLISAYFVPGAYDRKGPARFWKDRLIRLGIPLLIYSWLVNPAFLYGYMRVTAGLQASFPDFYIHEYFSYGYLIGQGPLWFIETLLIFTLVYAVWRLYNRRDPAISRPVQPSVNDTFPTNRALALFAVAMGLAGFAVRLVFPMHWNFQLLNLQFPYFAQYILMFIAGLLAYRRNWLVNMPDATGQFWLRVVGVVLLMYVPGALLGGALKSDVPFLGGWTWQSLYYSLWEAFLCVGLCLGVLYLFRRYVNRQSGFSTYLSRSAYATYIIQAPVITFIALLAREINYHPLVKFILVILVAVPLCFAIGAGIRRLPYADRVL